MSRSGKKPWVAGVDGGGTRTRVLLLDLADGRELARGEGPPSLADAANPEGAATVVREAVAATAGGAGLELPAAALWAGLAGVSREATRSAVEAALVRESVAERTRVDTDVAAAFHDAFERGPGILVIAGTGSVARGRAEDGREARVGGWGSFLGDEGSGYAIGIEALRRVVRHTDGRGPETHLRARVLEDLGVKEPDELVPWVARATKAQVAALVPLVEEAAAEGDTVAGEVLVKAVEELEGHVLTLLDALGPWERPPGLALAGGLLLRGGPLRRGLERLAGAHRLPVREEPLDAARGAAARAMRLAMGEGAQGAGRVLAR